MEPSNADITVIAHPGSRKDSIAIGDDGKSLIVHVTAPPEKGKANKAIVKLLAKRIGVGTSSVTIVRGATSSTKIIRVEGMDGARLWRELGTGP
ncbi:MAG: DUF167 domain-containing protein [Candidatus Lokiarchaeota archaeon]|nr:DUF167 domain-containing protein [Candidatus Lokiarchaeota archaeon]